MNVPLSYRYPAALWPSLAVTTILSVELLVSMEWLFFATKSSFLSVCSVGQRLQVLGVAPLPLLVVTACVLVPLAAVARLSRRRPRVTRLAERAAILVPTIAMGSLFVLMADNFANTMLGWSIECSAGCGRGVAVATVVSAFVLGSWTVAGWLRFFARHLRGGAFFAGACVAVSLLALAGTTAGRSASMWPDASRTSGMSALPPNILLLGSDGLSAAHLSAYGYERQTTPYLEALVPFSLFCENSFANCCHTTGSLVSMLTGRLPTETRVTYPPDILTGGEVYRHLPGLLKQLGYGTEQISIRHYGDAFDANLRAGFDRAAFRGRGAAQVFARCGELVGQEAAFFCETVVDRVWVRLAHAAGLGGMRNAYQEVAAGGRLTGHTDADRLVGLVDALRNTPEPFFIHTHFMATHGARFTPSVARFSVGQTQDRDWLLDFYDDAILEFDGVVGKLVEVLRRRGVLDNTLLIIYSDHGLRSDSCRRTPLLFIFPDGRHVGRITGNVQNLDIAPTIVDYLGVDVPDWMHGRSLLDRPLDPLRPVFSTGFRREALQRVMPGGPFVVDVAAAGPPFHSMGRLSMIVGQRAYSLDLTGAALEIHDLDEHTAPRSEDVLPGAVAAAGQLVDHLRQRDWDVSGLPDPQELAAGRQPSP